MESGFFEGFERERSARNLADDGAVFEFEPVGDQSTDVDPASEVAAFVNRPRPAQTPAATATQQQQGGGTRTVLSEMGFFR